MVAGQGPLHSLHASKGSSSSLSSSTSTTAKIIGENESEGRPNPVARLEPGPELSRDRLLRRKRTIKHFLKKYIYYPARSFLYWILFRPLILPRLRRCLYVSLIQGQVHSKLLSIASLPCKPPNSHRLVCLSDTHECLEHLAIPPGDVLVHAGDLAFKGGRGRKGYESITRFLRTLPHPFKVMIIGNHDWHAVDSFSKQGLVDLFGDASAVYLENDLLTLPNGLRIFGTPATPMGSSENTAFQYEVGDTKIFDSIPSGLDVLITHATPTGHCEGFGDDLLKKATDRAKPRVHVCGHDHAAYGASFNGDTLVINASIVDETLYWPFKPAIVYDLEGCEQS